MSDADAAEQRHNVPAAIRSRLVRVNAGSADWHDYHQLGVDLSELAESARRMVDFGSAIILLSQAHRYFRTAVQLAPREAVPLAAISCDRAIAGGREAFFTGNAELAESSANLVAEAIKVLLDHTNDQADTAAHHQLAIAYGMQCRLAHGWRLGFYGEFNQRLVDGYRAIALDLFEQEARATPDNGRAERSLMLALALGSTTHSERRDHAREAYLLAQNCGDPHHARRARAIMWFGNYGETFLRRRRDHKAVRELADLFAQLD